ncbi:hypothetical protein GON03_13470 [Nocardioides sp. MAH-18]|uniref:Uncharacterized protein n=1 Tax=Nocardioides agri TaxID=2682843 RepID=A0A6L6XTY4_9ACTN|nr:MULTISPECIES: hypothetical protein [unclassified Nocardioides]MBA2955342.1 hypothetical protein [Nocardioides sp. CGMCC 1.13656]MVQ50193.1 hypothetical protein [Nocardioides sp. MAH-18]
MTTADPRGPRIIEVTGGSAGLAARYDAVGAMAGDFETAAARLLELAGHDTAAAADGDLLGTAALAPVTFAEAQAALAAAGGTLVSAAASWETDALLVRAALQGLRASDALADAAIDELDRRLGAAVGITVRAVAPALVATVAVLPPEARERLDDRLQGWVLDHPGVVQHVVNGGGGALAGAAGVPALALGGRQATQLLAALYDDGRPVVHTRPDLSVPAGGTPPRSVADVVRHLREVAALSVGADSSGNGTIEVQTLDPGSDRVRHVVYLPGTDDIATLPWTQDEDVRDAGEDLHSAAGHLTAYQRGILQAMHDAGIRPGEPVLLVGHSLGGMEAAALAAHRTGFAISDVVTAGSPTAQVGGYPDGVHVLSLEQRGDVVPLTDGADNPDSVAQTTVVLDSGEPAETIGTRHDYAQYVAGAAAVDAATSTSVAEHVAGLHDRGFLSGADATTSQVFQITRHPREG